MRKKMTNSWKKKMSECVWASKKRPRSLLRTDPADVLDECGPSGSRLLKER